MCKKFFYVEIVSILVVLKTITHSKLKTMKTQAEKLQYLLSIGNITETKPEQGFAFAYKFEIDRNRVEEDDFDFLSIEQSVKSISVFIRNAYLAFKKSDNQAKPERREYFFQFRSGGWNTVYATNAKEACELACEKYSGYGVVASSVKAVADHREEYEFLLRSFN